MSLTEKDLQDIRLVVRDEAKSVVDHGLKPIEKRLDNIGDKLEALENDVKEIYEMLSERYENREFDKLPTKEKILDLHKKLAYTAKKAGVILPN